MTPKRMRAWLFLLGLGVLGALAGLQVVRSVPYATFFYVVGLTLMLTALEPFVGLIVYLIFDYVKLLWLLPGFEKFPLMLVVGGAAFASMLVRNTLEHRQRPILRTSPDYLMIWFLVAILFSHLIHGRLTGAITGAYEFVHCVVVYLLITNLVDSARRLDIVVQCLAVLTIWVAFEGLVAYYRGVGIGGLEPIQGRIRVLAFSADPNTYAGGLLLLVPFFFFEMIGPAAIGRRIVAALAIGVVCYTLVLTESRGGAVTLAVIAMLLLVRTVGLLKGAVIGLSAACAMYFLGPSRFQELNPTEASTFGRLVAWKRAFGEFHTSPLFGIGSKMSGPGIVIQAVPHNGFMQTTAELGLFGLVPWVLFIMVSVKNALYVSKYSAVRQFKRLALLSGAVSYGCLVWVVTLLSVGSPYYPELYIMSGLCVAATNIFAKTTGSAFVLLERKDFGYAILLTILLLAGHRLILYFVGL